MPLLAENIVLSLVFVVQRLLMGVWRWFSSSRWLVREGRWLRCHVGILYFVMGACAR